jgi:hypothetical protein
MWISAAWTDTVRAQKQYEDGATTRYWRIIGAGLAWLMMQVAHPNCFRARYADAVVYAGATDFVFELASGEKLSVRSSHEGIPISGSTPLRALGTMAPLKPQVTGLAAFISSA